MAARRKKSVKIANVEEEVVQHILPLGDLNGRKKKNQDHELVYSPCCVDKNRPGYRDVETSDSDDAMGMCLPTRTSEDIVDEDALYGGEVYKFKTVKKSGQMVNRAADCVTPKTTPVKKTPGKNTPGKNTPGKNTPGKNSPNGLKRGENDTPGKSKRLSMRQNGTPKKEPGTPGKNRGRDSVGTPTSNGTVSIPKSFGKQKNAPETPPPGSQAAHRQHKRVESSTPYRLKKRNQEQDSSSDDSVDESSEEEEEGGEEGCEGQTEGRGDAMSQNATAEAYFDLHSQAAVTSDRTLANLDGPRMDVSDVREALRGVAESHGRETKALREEQHKMYNKWMLNLCHGYNILLYGLGSKRSLLDDFRRKHISKFSHIVVNGYFPSLTVKHILNSITEEILDEQKATFSNPSAQLQFIKDQYKYKDEDFFIIIHNIDGVLLRSDKVQAVLSQLAQVQGFHIVASIDHINAPFLWDQNKCFKFSWLWFETPTFLPYASENAYENSLLVQQSGQLALSSMLHVMHSLTPNGRRIFLMLARYQLDHCDSSNYIGMSFQHLYQECREAFLVNSDLTLQAQLVEFRDHRLIRSKKNYEGIEHLLIPVDQATLTEFLKEYKDEAS